MENTCLICEETENMITVFICIIRGQKSAIYTRPRFPRYHPYDDDVLIPFELASYNDDLPLDQADNPSSSNPNSTSSSPVANELLEVKTYTEFPAVSRSNAPDNFTVLINLKAPDAIASRESSSSRVPVDLVNVLDVSGSMAGSKIALLKRATARCVFPLRRMSGSGKQQALEAVNSLTAGGSTNIAEGLRLGAKVMEDRRHKNPISGIILLSDGEDICRFSSSRGYGNIYKHPDYQQLLPPSFNNEKSSNFKVPTASEIQHAFAQCIGGLLSVMVKELQVKIESIHSRVSLCGLKSGSYSNQITPDGRMGNIDVGDLYAEEERDFLVAVKAPSKTETKTTTLLN
ncbi:OLC1v1026071C1 [Oldenlandia corymbosa var. corymbosa]|uniref:OLC1v1026071C1 n=1 Tax=Oldenlandia corymbosa var. corymbosa TaxID=529605 RepID=A0AAV1C806_OLDCO|nr:OLC1v1026071C1 [Oldenlandia corymbosa var. corymbosa]